MNYGYFNAFITNIGEEVPDKVEALHKKADEIIDEIGANIVCPEEGFDFSTAEGKGARKAFAAAVPLINADPLTGFFK